VSRGLGRIEQAILRAIEKHKVDSRGAPIPLRLTSWHLVSECFPELFSTTTWSHPPPTLAQQKTISRAMHSLVRKFPEYALMGGNGRKRLCLYEPADPMSVLWARLAVERSDFVSLLDVHMLARAIADAQLSRRGWFLGG
jgi:hypothetical protein